MVLLRPEAIHAKFTFNPLLQKAGKGQKGRRKGQAKSSLKQPPYSLKDGDVIGIKVCTTQSKNIACIHL